MNFNTGSPVTNSERYNSCDSLWAHMYDLSHMTSDGSWSASYGDLKCWADTSSTWYLHKDSNSELHVNQTSGGIC
jgi:hypothetical protein